MNHIDESWNVGDRKRALQLDKIGYWSEVKLDIIKDYAAEYTKILSKRSEIKDFAYIDAFAGVGVHVSKRTGEFVLGSALNALAVTPKFSHYYYIDLDSLKIDELKAAIQNRDDVTVRCGDCNAILLQDVFPHVRYEDYHRALCLLDPYGLHLSWQVIHRAGQMKSIDMFLNFPVMDMNRNVLWRKPDLVSKDQAERMTRYWGDETWRDVAYHPASDLFDKNRIEKVPNANEAMAAAFRRRLREVAGFANVPEPIPMRNNLGATVYYLFFASQKDVANSIVKYIFKKYADRQADSRKKLG